MLMTTQLLAKALNPFSKGFVERGVNGVRVL